MRTDLRIILPPICVRGVLDECRREGKYVPSVGLVGSEGLPEKVILM